MQWNRIVLFTLFLAGTLTLISCGDDETTDPGTLPVASFTSETALMEGDSLLLTNTSTDATAYQWNVTPGNMTSTEENAGFELTDEGTYTVTLIATGAGGSDTTTKAVTVAINNGYRAFGKTMKVWYVHSLTTNGIDFADDDCYWDNTLTFVRADSSFAYEENDDFCSNAFFTDQSGTYSPMSDFSAITLDIMNPPIGPIVYNIDYLSRDTALVSTEGPNSSLEMTLVSTPRTN